METVVIGGRVLVPIGEATARHDAFVMRQIAACGLNVAAEQKAEETEEQFMYRLYLTAVKNGDVFALLGALLVPEGTEPLKWSPELAKQTGEFLANLTDPADKAKLRTLVASALLPFFVGGRRPSRTSRKSSMPHSAGSGRPHTERADGASTAAGD